MPNPQNLVAIKKGQVLNPNGRPKGAKNLSTWIQNLLNDENFETVLIDSKKGIVEYKGAPIKALIQAAIHRAIHDEKNGVKWAEWLGKYGYGIALKMEETQQLNVVHIYKPEKLDSAQLEFAAEQLRERAERAVEGELSEVDIPTGASDLRPLDS